MSESNPRLGLNHLLGLPPSSDFLSKVWPTNHYGFDGPLDRFPGIAQAPQLSSIESVLNSPHQRLRVFFRNADGSHGEDYVSPQQAYDLFKRKQVDTIVVDGVHWGIPPLADTLLTMQEDLKTPQSLVQCTAYISPKGHGTQMHFDQQEVFFLQILGNKRWRVAPNNQVKWPLSPFFGYPYMSPDLEQILDGEPVQLPEEIIEVEMTPGSAFFLPRGYWHSSYAHEDSLAITFTFASRSWLELFWERAREKLIVQEEWREIANGFRKGSLEKADVEKLSSLIESLKSVVESLSTDEIHSHAQEMDEKRTTLEKSRIQTIRESTKASQPAIDIHYA